MYCMNPRSLINEIPSQNIVCKTRASYTYFDCLSCLIRECFDNIWHIKNGIKIYTTYVVSNSFCRILSTHINRD